MSFVEGSGSRNLAFAQINKGDDWTHTDESLDIQKRCWDALSVVLMMLTAQVFSGRPLHESTRMDLHGSLIGWTTTFLGETETEDEVEDVQLLYLLVDGRPSIRELEQRFRNGVIWSRRIWIDCSSSHVGRCVELSSSDDLLVCARVCPCLSRASESERSSPLIPFPVTLSLIGHRSASPSATVEKVSSSQWLRRGFARLSRHDLFQSIKPTIGKSTGPSAYAQSGALPPELSRASLLSHPHNPCTFS